MATISQIYASFTKIISVVRSMVEWMKNVIKACWLVTRNYLRWKGHTHPQGLRYKTPITHFTTIPHVSSFQYLLIPFYHNILKQLLLSQDHRGRCDRCWESRCTKDQGINKDNFGCAESFGCGCNAKSGNGSNSCDKMVPMLYGKSQFCGGGSFMLYCGSDSYEKVYEEEINYINEVSGKNLSFRAGVNLKMANEFYFRKINYSNDLQKWNRRARKKNHLEFHQKALLSLKPRISISEGSNDDENEDYDQVDGCEYDKKEFKNTCALRGRSPLWNVAGTSQSEKFLHNLQTCVKVQNPLLQKEDDDNISFSVLSVMAGDKILPELSFKATECIFEESSSEEFDPCDFEEIECDDIYDDYEDNTNECWGLEDDDDYEDNTNECWGLEDDDDDEDNTNECWGLEDEDEEGWESEDCHPYDEWEDNDDFGVVFSKDLDDYDNSLRNQCRNNQDEDAGSDSIIFTNEEDLTKKEIKRVRFSQKIDYIYDVGEWTMEEVKSSRKGGWEEMVRDRNRFERRVEEVGKVIAYVLQPLHRETLFVKLYGKQSECARTFDNVEFFNIESEFCSYGNDNVNIICDVSGMNEVYIEGVGNGNMNCLVDFEGTCVDENDRRHDFGNNEVEDDRNVCWESSLMSFVGDQACCVDYWDLMQTRSSNDGGGGNGGGGGMKKVNCFDYIDLFLVGIVGICDFLCGSEVGWDDVYMGSSIDQQYNSYYSSNGCRFQHASNTQKDLLKNHPCYL